MKHCPSLFVAEDKFILILRSDRQFCHISHCSLAVTVGGWAFFTRLHEPSSCWGAEKHRAECQIVPWEVSAWPQVWTVATSHCQQWAETPNSLLPFCHITATVPSQHGKWFVFVFRSVCKTPNSVTWFWIVRSTTSWVLTYKMLGYWIFSGIVKDAGCMWK